MILIIGNLVSLLGCLCMVASGIIKDKKKTILVQTVQIALMTASNFILGGITGGFVNLVGVFRNIFCYKGWFSLPIKLVFLAISAGLTAYFNNAGLIGWLPIIAVGIFTLLMDTKSAVVLKLLIISSCILWGIYDFTFQNYTAVAFDIATIISSCVGIYRIKKGEAI